MSYQLGELASRVGGILVGDDSLRISGVGALGSAQSHQITFAESERYQEQVQAGSAGAVIVDQAFPELPGCNLLRVDNPRFAFVQVVELFVPVTEVTGIHPDATIDPEAKLAEGVSVGPCAVISKGAALGEDSSIHAGVYIGTDVTLGKGCSIGPNVSIMADTKIGDRVKIHPGTVVGGDGYGYLWTGDHHHKIPQIGNVVIEDDVEIGCNSCIDCAALGMTRIGQGTKIDNLVHIAHNVDIGAHVIVTGQVGFAGSVTLGDGVVIGAQAGFSDHVNVGAGTRVAARAGIIGDVDPGSTVMGFPAREIGKAKREMASMARLPQLRKQIQQQAKQLDILSARLEQLEQNGDG
ncbi:MAG: UDP-3-O-(3-hydroxymyristoyl)glucosamine N-acyltransferase [Gammaproteobacteria bacterium]|nr:UDP-3-O-(3-hydroxymyristoyl)glucosamine N-acyltransferase [Gammaproteobacteria bacterium]